MEDEENITIAVSEYKCLLDYEWSVRALKRYLHGKRHVKVRELTFFLKANEPHDCTHDGSNL